MEAGVLGANYKPRVRSIRTLKIWLNVVGAFVSVTDRVLCRYPKDLWANPVRGMISNTSGLFTGYNN